MSISNQEELFSEKEVVIKSTSKRMALSDKQLLSIKRDKVIKYFCDKWNEKYGIKYILPHNSFMAIQRPISIALAYNYTQEMLQKAIENYLANDFKGYVDNSHPIRFFTNDISKWVLQSQRQIQAPTQKEITADDKLREINMKYGLIRKNNGWVAENGLFFVDLESAIKAIEKKGGAKSESEILKQPKL